MPAKKTSQNQISREDIEKLNKEFLAPQMANAEALFSI